MMPIAQPFLGEVLGADSSVAQNSDQRNEAKTHPVSHAAGAHSVILLGSRSKRSLEALRGRRHGTKVQIERPQRRVSRDIFEASIDC